MRRHSATVGNTRIRRSDIATDPLIAALCKFIHYIVAKLTTYTSH